MPCTAMPFQTAPSPFDAYASHRRLCKASVRCLAAPHRTQPHHTQPNPTEPGLMMLTHRIEGSENHLYAAQQLLTSPRRTEPNQARPHLTIPHLTRPNRSLPHLITPHRTSPNHAMPSRASPHRTRPHRINDCCQSFSRCCQLLTIPRQT